MAALPAAAVKTSVSLPNSPSRSLLLWAPVVAVMAAIFYFSSLMRGITVITNDQISRHTANEAGEPLRFSHIPMPDLFQNDAEGLLIEVFSDCRVIYFAANDDPYASAITLDQFGAATMIGADYAAQVFGIEFG